MSMAQWTEQWPMDPRVTSSMLSQGTCLFVGQVPSWGSLGDMQIDQCFPLFFPPFPLSKKINK